MFTTRSKHSCTDTKCGVCYEIIDKLDFLHQCRIRPIKLKKKLPNAIQVFYDIECYLDNDNNQAFRACLAVAQTACYQCTIYIKDNTESDICENCRSLNKTFLGTSCVDEFLEFLLQMEVEYGPKVKVIYAIALNSGRFDTWLLMQSILTNSDLLQTPPVMCGNKILLLQI